MRLARRCERIRPLDPAAMAAARELQARLTKPAGSLGRLEELAERLAGLAGRCPPPIPTRTAVAIFAGDHGVHAQGVTPWPQEVTAQMVANFLAGGAVINAFARQVGADVVVIDVGVAHPLGPERPGVATTDGLWERRIRPGTADLSREPAMTREQARAAIEVGLAVATELVADGYDCLVTGDMGIANTTPAAALIAAFTGAPAVAVTGRGTGVDDDMLAHKTKVVTDALELHQPDRDRSDRRAGRGRRARTRRTGRVHPGRRGASGPGDPRRCHRRFGRPRRGGAGPRRDRRGDRRASFG